MWRRFYICSQRSHNHAVESCNWNVEFNSNAYLSHVHIHLPNEYAVCSKGDRGERQKRKRERGRERGERGREGGREVGRETKREIERYRREREK